MSTRMSGSGIWGGSFKAELFSILQYRLTAETPDYSGLRYQFLSTLRAILASGCGMTIRAIRLKYRHSLPPRDVVHGWPGVCESGPLTSHEPVSRCTNLEPLTHSRAAGDFTVRSYVYPGAAKLNSTLNQVNTGRI